MDTAVTLAEWQTLRPTPGSPLAGRRLADDGVRRLAENLRLKNQLHITELAAGLEVQAQAYVGRVVLGDLQITIQPKLKDAPLLRLVRYAYRLRDLDLKTDAHFGASADTFQDLLCEQLEAEVEELWKRGLQRRYQRADELLASPRGRIDFRALARQTGTVRAALPCTHFPRHEDHLLNRMLLAGLQLAARLTDDVQLRLRLRRMAGRLAEQITPEQLNAETLRAAQRKVDRQTRAYAPALTLIELLAAGQGISLDESGRDQPLSGFLFDMNLFFQNLLARFLKEFLSDWAVREQYQLPDAMAYLPAYNPRAQRAPVLRPDFAIMHGPRVTALLDAKYRDLWEQGLPTHMLYQLAMYAVSWSERHTAVILYATMDPGAREERIELRVPLRDGQHTHVVLRPVILPELDELLQARRRAERECRQFARRMAFGESEK